jgi:hypothetical protein
MPSRKRLNQRQEAFAQGIAAGLNGVEAFKCATPGNPKDCDVKADKMRRQPIVEARIKELTAQNAKLAQITREQMLAWLTRVITTGAGDVTPTDSLCQAHKHTSGDGWEAHEIRVPDKLGAAAQLARMCGWNEPDQVRLSGTDSLSAYLLELRSQPISGPILPLERHQLSLENGEKS